MPDNTCASSHSGGGDTAHIPPQVPKSESYLRNLHQAHLARLKRVEAAAVRAPKPAPAPVVVAAPPPPAPKPAPPAYVYKPRWYWIGHEWLGESEGFVEPDEAPRILMAQVVDSVCKYYGISDVEIKSKRRTKVIARQRQVAMYLVKEMTRKTLPEIGRHLGGRDHTTILHGVRQIARLIRFDERLAAEIEEIKATVGK